MNDCWCTGLSITISHPNTRMLVCVHDCHVSAYLIRRTDVLCSWMVYDPSSLYTLEDDEQSTHPNDKIAASGSGSSRFHPEWSSEPSANHEHPFGLLPLDPPRIGTSVILTSTRAMVWHQQQGKLYAIVTRGGSTGFYRHSFASNELWCLIGFNAEKFVPAAQSPQTAVDVKSDSSEAAASGAVGGSGGSGGAVKLKDNAWRLHSQLRTGFDRVMIGWLPGAPPPPSDESAGSGGSGGGVAVSNDMGELSVFGSAPPPPPGTD